MKKKLLTIVSFLLLTKLCFSAPTTSISIPNSFSPNTTISSSAVNSNFNEGQTEFNAHSHTDITQVGTITTGTWQGTDVGTAYGGTGNSYGIGLPSGAIFFMITGSCPSGSTDVSTTYANKFIKTNATAGTSSGVVLTGTSDSHTLTTGEIPAHTHTVPSPNGDSGGTYKFAYDAGSDTPMTGTPAVATNSAGSDGGHTHTSSTATTLEPSSITCKMCQVD